MRIEDRFTVAAPFDVVWDALTDLEVVAGCLPGAVIDGVDEDGVHRGRMTVRLGSVAAAFEGTARLEHVDRDAGTVLLRATGGSRLGSVDLSIAGSAADDGASTPVELVTEVELSGRLAQFGHAVGERVTRQLVGKLVAGLETRLTGAEPAGSDAGGHEDLDLRTVLSAARPTSVPGRLVTVAAATLAGLALGWWLSGRWSAVRSPASPAAPNG